MPRPRAAGDSLETFMQHVNKTKSCWLWTGAITIKGHGRVTWNRQTKPAHRVSWILHNGLILPGLVVCHICPNKLCVRPSHLYLGTVADNTTDGNRVPNGQGRMPYVSRKHNPAQWFWNILGNPTDSTVCWVWPKSCNTSGYGIFNLTFPDGTHEETAHRVAWILTHGPIPHGLVVCHNCPTGDNPACCNPAHLWLGTQRENIIDRNRKGRGGYERRKPRIRQKGEYLRGRWSMKHPACVCCGTTAQRHHSRGLCKLCYATMHRNKVKAALALG